MFDQSPHHELLEKFQPLTMLNASSLGHLAQVTQYVLDKNIAGDFVECGTWKGGASFLMADLASKAPSGKNRRVWMYDSFEGLPPPDDKDGTPAFLYASETDKNSLAYRDNCRASLPEVTAAVGEFGLGDYCKIVPGWFKDTLPAQRPERIAILRIDADWYEGTALALELLYDLVTPGGFVVFDDYYTWPGSTMAVNNFLAGKSECLEQHDSIAYINKGQPPFSFTTTGFITREFQSAPGMINRTLEEAYGEAHRHLALLSEAYNRVVAELGEVQAVMDKLKRAPQESEDKR
jgi:O-methyltransferase